SSGATSGQVSKSWRGNRPRKGARRTLGQLRLTRVVPVAAVVLALGAIAGALASQTLARRSPGPAPKIITPRTGQRVAAGPVSVKLQVGDSRRLNVRLNGRSIASGFFRAGGRVPCLLAIKSSHPRGAVCRLEVSPNYG